jgi:hypothetical protein
MQGHGSLRDRIARTLNTAYGDGLLSEHTLAHRLDVLCGSHVIEPAGLLVGRHLGCDIVLDDLSVSRRHARLRFRDGHWVLQDLQSTNGTLVNRAPVVRCQLQPGDEVHVGTCACSSIDPHSGLQRRSERNPMDSA